MGGGPKSPQGAAFENGQGVGVRTWLKRFFGGGQEKILSAEEFTAILDASNQKIPLYTVSIRVNGKKVRIASSTENPGGGEQAEQPKPVGSGVGSKSSPQAMELFDREALEDMQMSQLLIDDPLGYEEAQIDRHIEKARNAESREYRRVEPAL
jgi:hypothetical protein